MTLALCIIWSRPFVGMHIFQPATVHQWVREVRVIWEAVPDIAGYSWKW